MIIPKILIVLVTDVMKGNFLTVLPPSSTQDSKHSPPWLFDRPLSALGFMGSDAVTSVHSPLTCPFSALEVHVARSVSESRTAVSHSVTSQGISVPPPVAQLGLR